MNWLERYPKVIDTKDLDELRQVMSGHLNWRLKFSADRHIHSVSRAVTLPGLTVSETTTAGGLIVSLVPASYSLTLVEGAAVSHQSEHDAPFVYAAGEGFLRSPGREHRSVLTSDGVPYSSVTITIPKSLVNLEAEKLIEKPVKEPLIITEPLDLRTSDGLGHLVTVLLDQLRREDGGFTKFEEFTKMFGQLLVNSLITSTHNNYQGLIGTGYRGKARRTVEQFEWAITRHLDDWATVEQIAREEGINIRTLRDNCQHVRGCSPGVILRFRRVMHARVRSRVQPEES